ncbi:DcaP family trimeric outer membrane transporter [Agaribacter marinus]|uniref:Porin n=1 Tax=Agaribacter marinus TaxID=1431249 RepID=A0AA37WG81_9ALTE|nr:DcaP family trimeric outer membrane transporter [Agaribacter marinus]GLR69901.1 hypothetical protein GCM10007852_08090 [Agaribacter marinus]
MRRLITTTLLVSLYFIFSPFVHSEYKVKLSEDQEISFGGYIKVDSRYVDGDVAYRPFWIGTGQVLDESKSQFNMNVAETRLNTKYKHGEVTGFVEIDFLGGGGNEIVSNSHQPRLRHAFIKYKDILAGQTWSTFMNTSAIAETADFAGATVGLVFIRQAQIRYSHGNFKFAIENPESWGGDTSSDVLPDIIGRYDFKGDWGGISVSTLVRQLNTSLEEKETSVAGSVAGRINVGEKNDIKFQFHKGELGRYVGVAFAPDLIGNEVESTTSTLVAYRHFWNDSLRSTILFGKAVSDLSDLDRSQWSVNIFDNLTDKLTYGFELGQFRVDDKDADSNYAQFSLTYKL